MPLGWEESISLGYDFSLLLRMVVSIIMTIHLHRS